MIRGIAVPDVLPSRGLTADPGSAGGDVSPGIELLLPEGIPVITRRDGTSPRRSPHMLALHGGRTVVETGTERTPATIVPPSLLAGKRTSSGVPMSDFAGVDGSWLMLAPSSDCGLFSRRPAYRFCSPGARGSQPAPAKPVGVEDVMEAAECAFSERKISVVSLFAGSQPGEDGGVFSLQPYIRELNKHFKALIMVEALPPAKEEWVDWSYAVGIDGICYTLGVWDRRLFAEICPGRGTEGGRERCLDALRYAATVFPRGAVFTHLIAGLEPVRSLMEGIESLTRMGVVPLIPVFRPLEGTASEDRVPPGADEIAPAYLHLHACLRKNRIPAGWVTHLGSVITPGEAGLIASGRRGLDKALGILMASGLGRSTTRGLSRIRRRLRVRRAEG